MSPTGLAFEAQASELVRRQLPRPEEWPRAAVAPDQVVLVTAPARIDFAGGWSDTPPICTDRGGTVVNAAVSLNGRHPIQARAKLNRQGVINLTSLDLGRHVCLTRIEQLLDHTNPRQWASLPSACLWLMGLAGGRTCGSLGPVLHRFGGGIDLSIYSALPKGSGLGTSSILGMTILRCLATLSGQPWNQVQLIEQTSLLEQRMTTGGGWQDQAGAILPGVKLLTTEPGERQVPSVTPLAFDLNRCAGPMLLYFTGLKRLARDILQKVVGRYRVGDRVVLDTVHRLKESALALRQAIDLGDREAFAEGLRQSWELKKQMAPGSSNAALEALIAWVAPWCRSYTVPGAGGGGFLLMVATDEEAARHIRRDLTAVPASPGARFFDFAIDVIGLREEKVPGTCQVPF
jgi:galactokinase/mevalonate kinase-like predicted kinase